MAKPTVKDMRSGKMDEHILVNLKMTKGMDKEQLNFLTARSMLVNGKMAKNMVKENKHFLLEKYIWDNS